MEHEIVQELKRIAVELGRAPTRREFQQFSKIGNSTLYKIFKSYEIALKAAGLPSSARQSGCFKKKPKLSDEQVFGKNILDHLMGYHQNPAEGREISFGEKIAIAGDLHLPFVRMDLLSAFFLFLAEVQPDIVLQIGDLYDYYGASKFPRSVHFYPFKQEVELGFQMACEFWAKVKEICPKARRIQLLGNHDIRPIKRIQETAPEMEIFMDFAKWFKFDGVESYLDTREEIIINGIVFQHGHYSGNNGQHRDYNQMNSVTGHTHTGFTAFRNIKNQVLWELNAGFMGDPASKALGYTPQKITTWTGGWGFIDKWGPRFIAF